MDIRVPQYNGITKIWHGVGQPKPTDPTLSAGKMVLDSLAKHGSKVLQVTHDTGYEMTAAEMRTRTVRLAQNLVSKSGLKSTDVVAIISRNNENVAALVFACLAVGAPFMPLDASYQKSDIKHMVGIGKPKIIFCEEDKLEIVQSALQEMENVIPIVTFDKSEDDSVPFIGDYLKPTGNEDNFKCEEFSDATTAIAAIMCSSGTTGLPKGVTISHAQLVVKTAGGWNVSLFTFSSLFWFSGLALVMASVIGGDLRVITAQKFSPKLFFEIIAKYKIAGIFTPPFHFFAMLEDPLLQTADLSSLRMVLCGGSMVSDHLKQSMQKYIPNGLIVNTYASTEMGGLISLNIANQPNSVGCLLPGIEAKIIDEDGKYLGPNQYGEVCLRTQPYFLGYYGNEEATMGVSAGDNFICTGDIGNFDDEGFLYLVDRKKDVLKYCGYQISPFELEQIIEEIEGVSMASVVGIPSEASVDLPAAAVIRMPNATVTAQEIIDYVAERVQDVKRLRGGVYFLDEFPLTATGKTLKRKVKEIVVNLYNQQNN